ncbi:lipid II flippase MurJ, partial [Methylobacterium trifolii]
AGLRPRAILAAGAEFLRRLRPLLALPVAEQGNVWIERVMASRLVTGTVASMDYARTITDSAILLISQPLGLAVMSREPSKDVPGEVARIARPILAAALPVSVFLMLFAPEVARIVFSRGAFNEHAVLLSSQALRGIAAGLWAATLGWILLRMLNSSGRNAAAALILSLSFGANAGFNLLTWHLQETSGAGPLLFGFGEALRGLVLLAGTVLMLGCAGRMLRLTAIAAIPAGLMALAGWQIHVGLAGTLERLAAGSAAC